MKTRFLFLVRYAIYWLLIFTLFRLIFLVYQFNQTLQISFSDFISINIRGIWMDTSLMGYILLLSSLVIAVFFFIDGKWLSKIFNVITILLLTIFSIIAISDFELYRNWGFRIDATPLLYLKTPKEAMASVKTIMIVVLVIATAITVTGLFYCYKRWVSKLIKDSSKGKWWLAAIFIFISAAMILPIRGGLGIAAMNPGKVYFSQNVYCNHAALNPIWNMMYSISKSGSMYKRYPVDIDPKQAKEVFASMMKKGETDSVKVIRDQRPNIVILLMESFSSKLIETLGGKKGITPNFNKLSNEGILFTKVLSSGDRSDKGIIATVAAFPAQSTQSIIKFPLKSQKLPTLSGTLVENGYHATFYYGGDPDFANIRSFLYSAKFSRIVTQDDFPRKYRNSKWGVHDEYVFNYLLNDIDTAKGPFFKMFFTLSSHEPFEIPAKPKFPGKDEVIQYINSAYYTDSCVGNFFNEAKKRDWYKNTLFILIADHGHRHLGSWLNYDPEKFAIPMLWLGGDLNCSPTRIDKRCSQIDLTATLLNQMGINDSSFVFSKDIFNKNTLPFAYYAFNDGFGFVTQTDTIIYDHISRKYIEKNGVDVDKANIEAKSFFSVYQDIFLGL